ncbi:hypothetical protein HHK36_032101 [Tetracentron sinense]|uniref:Uncharacterized protein n=1 Tax=Tetracentron sinense TaxID=13715 RepID=A0A835CXY3_TETSI|nr:hypothetical protein HHK36_032101 [Tetracentron sinense]
MLSVVLLQVWQDKLALWTKTATNEAAQMSIGRKWKEIIDVTDKITYREMIPEGKSQSEVDTVCEHSDYIVLSGPYSILSCKIVISNYKLAMFC